MPIITPAGVGPGFTTISTGLAMAGFASKTGSRVDFNLDGNYAAGFPVGLPVPAYPFLNQGDRDTVIFRQPWEQALSTYQPPLLTSGYPGVAGAYPLGDVNFRDGEAGVVKFERLFCNIPKQRVRKGQSFRYAFQYIMSSGTRITSDGETITGYEGPTYSVGTRPFTVDSTLTMDYFLAGQESRFPLYRAPTVEQYGTGVIPRGQGIDGAAFPLVVRSGCVCSDVDILAEDDSYDDWMGAIRCRVRRTIAGPTLAFWIANSTGNS